MRTAICSPFRAIAMRPLSALIIGALLTTGFVSVGSAAAPSNKPPTAIPAPSVQPAETRSAAKNCEKEAKAKGLAGDSEKSFVKDCLTGKKN